MFKEEKLGLVAFFAARIEAIRRNAPAQERAALLRLLADERRQTFKALAERKKMATLGAREQHRLQQQGEREMRRQNRRPPPAPD